MKSIKLKWHQDGGDLCCKRDRDGIYACVAWMVAPWRYQVLRMKKEGGEWVSIKDGPSFSWSNEGRAKAKKWASNWIFSVLPNATTMEPPKPQDD